MAKQLKCKHTHMEICPLDDRYVQCANTACTDPDRARRYRRASDEKLYELREMQKRAAKNARKREAKRQQRETIESGGLFEGLVEPIKLDDKGHVIKVATHVD